MSDTPHVAVVGAGLAGASVAWELSRRGASVDVYERYVPACGASGAAAGVLQPVTGRTGRAAPYHVEGMRYTFERVDELGLLGHSADRRGVVRVALNDDQAQTWSSRVPELPPGVGVWLDDVQLRRRASVVSPNARGGILVEEAGTIDVATFARATLAASEVAVHRYREVIRVDEADAGVRLHVDSESVPYTHAVIAAGAATNEVLGEPLVPLRAAHGEVAVFRAATALELVLSSGGYVFEVAPGQWLVGATMNERDHVQGVRAEAAALLGERLLKLTGLSAPPPLLAMRSGIRPATRDRVPRVDRVARSGRIWAFTGHGAKGLLLAPLSASWLAEELLGDRDDRVPERWRLR